MKVFFKNLKTVLIVILILIIILQRSCSDEPLVTEPQVITKVETKWDTITIEKDVYIPKWKTKIVTKYENDTILISIPIDTLAVLKDYYAKNVYIDEIILDSLGIVTITDTISQNTIFSRQVKSNILIPITTVTEEHYINNREFYYGFGLQGNKKQLNYLGGGILYKDRKKHIYGIGLGFNQDLEPVISGRVYWKIGKK